MLVEDDNSLREIYQARLMAEGYQIVTAKDGEEALALVATEKPDLIILDIMMPKISGFDTLDILRSTNATAGTKVIMMSALSQAEDKTRAEKLGANKYLVKSQVTLEDIVKTVKEVLASEELPHNPTMPSAPGVGPAVAEPNPPTPTTTFAQPQAPTPVPSAPLATPTPPQTMANSSDMSQPSMKQIEDEVNQQAEPAAVEQSDVNQEEAASFDVNPQPSMPPLATASTPVAPVTPPPSEPTSSASTVPISGSATISTARASIPAPIAEPETPPITPMDVPATVSNAPQTVGGTKVINPINSDLNPKSRLDDLLAAEEAKEKTTSPQPQPPSEPTSAPPAS